MTIRPESPNLLKKFFEDHEGRIVLWQWPNLPIYAWVVFRTLSIVSTTAKTKLSLNELSSAFLFVWAYSELAQGITYFRRLLGLIVLVLVILNFFGR